MKYMYLSDTIIIGATITLIIVSILGSAWYLAKSNGITYRSGLRILWQEGFVAGFKDCWRNVIPAAKKAMVVLRECGKQLYKVIADYLHTEPPKHQFTPELYYALQNAVSGYVYTPFQPVIQVAYFPAPSYVYISLYTKAAVTEEVKAEVVWAIVAKFREYMAAYDLNFPHSAIPYCRDNFMEVYVYYADRTSEFPAYQARVQSAMRMTAEPAFKPLSERDVTKTAGLVLGYELNKWKSAGQVAPILWDTAAAPHMMISGPTGGGKTVYVKLILEQLLKAGASVTVCDFKGQGDYNCIKDYAAGTECDTVLARFCSDFEKSRAQSGDGRRRVLIFDEFGSYVASKDKKEFDAIMKMISGVIFMGRSYGYSVILISQRFDAETIKTALREQCGIKIYMGSTISQQAATMLFPNSELDKSNRLPPCCGYYSTPKTDLATLTIPKVDIPALDRRLKILGARSNE